ncbi:glycosyltransferase family 25 protein [Mesorhizobium sp. ORM8.1]
MDIAVFGLHQVRLMKCLVINLDRSSDRLAHVAAEFERIGISFERIAALDARGRPELSSMQRLTKHRLQSRLTNGEIACLLSHKACWSIIAAGDDEHVAVFEDDVVFTSAAGGLLADAGWIPADADIVKLETFFRRAVIGPRRIAVGNGFSLSRLHTPHLGCAGYILSKRIAGSLVEATEEIAMPVDHVLFDPVRQRSPVRKIYQLSPALCVQKQHLDGAAQLPSLIPDDRDGSATTVKPRLSQMARVKREVERLARRLNRICRLQFSSIVPFDHQGERMYRPHTQRGENAL